MGCRARWRGDTLQLEIDGTVVEVKNFDATSVDIDAVCDEARLAEAICGQDVECILRVAAEAQRCCREAVEKAIEERLSEEFNPYYGIDVDEFVVSSDIVVAPLKRLAIFQAGIVVRIPEEYAGVPPRVWREPESEVEIAGRRVKVGDVLRWLGIDPSRKYYVVRVPSGIVAVYVTKDKRILVTNQLLAPGVRVRFFVHRQHLGVQRLAAELQRYGVDVDEDDLVTWISVVTHLKREKMDSIRVVYAYPHAPLRRLEEVAARVAEALGEVGNLSVSSELLVAYLAVAGGGHVEYAVPHALIATPPGVGKTLLATRLCLYTFSRLTEATVLGGANVAKGVTFGSILDGRVACVQIEHAESLKTTIINELLTLMSTGESSRGVLGNEVTARVLSPLVFTANVRGSDPLTEAAEIISVLTSNNAAAGRRFGIVYVTSAVPPWEPTRDEIDVLERIGLARFIVENPAIHAKLSRIYREILDTVEFSWRVKLKPTGSMIVDPFITEYYKKGFYRAVHAALNVITMYHIDKVVKSSVDELMPLYEDRVEEVFRAVETLVKDTLEFLSGGRPRDFDAILRTMPRYVAKAVLAITSALDEAMGSGGSEVRFSDVYSAKEYGRNSLRRVVSMIARYATEFKAALEAWAGARGVAVDVEILEDDVVVRVSGRG